MNEHAEAVRKMQKYIEEHIDEVITPAQLAEVSLFSPWYASRLFAEYTGMTPARYIRRLKLSRSALRLRDEKCRVIDAAMDLGFGSVDGYQRAFRSEFGINPKEYALSPVPIQLFVPTLTETNEKRERIMTDTRTIFVTRIGRPARKVIIKRGIKADEYFSYCNEVGCDVWGILLSIRSVCGEPVCLWLPEKYRPAGTSRYVQGSEVDINYNGIVPEGYDIIELPECEYLMFQGEPFAEEDYAEAINEIWEAEKRYDPKLIGLEWDNESPRIQLEPRGERGYIELVPVKKQ
ncbi:AraC family transcriptional regulator [Ruminococcus sp.]|uniref:helix-turn-helix domain-containing protein n=1 Tax=Ruminococcus sp. TaxID=41978 RepID=UPI0025FFE98B|nr:AraC family transcriptional regulator [Ruminococcus sp.]MBQ8965233.1 helix-turn-helix transcriptional regulator [Ruminococcus sp.]